MLRSRATIILMFCMAIGVAAGLLADSTPAIVVKEPFEAHQAHGGGKSGSTLITYHGGLVMTGAPVSVYVIYYGAVDSATRGIVNQFFTDLSTSAPYKVNTTYTDKSGASIAPTFYFNPISYSANGWSTGSLYEDAAASQGTSLSNNSVPAIVKHAIDTQGLPADQNGVYFVITAADIKVAGFCKSFCAYHTSSTSIAAGMHIRYALVPDPGLYRMRRQFLAGPGRNAERKSGGR